MGRRVVEGGPIRFRDDLPIVVGEVSRPLALPPITILPDRFTIWYKARFFELGEHAGGACATIWRRPYGLCEAETAGSREARFTKGDDVVRGLEEWLRRCVRGAVSSRDLGGQLAQALREKVEELHPVPDRPPRCDVGTGKVKRRSDGSVLARMHGYERILHVDGKIYDLLTLAEYLARFEKAMEPAFFKSLQKACGSATPVGICRRMADGLDRMDKVTFGVIRGKVHYDDRTFTLFLDGVYFVPEFLCTAASFLTAYRSRVERELKIGFLEKAR